jgi:peptidoglycan/LPS O-acetylase OafA/YrhL
MKYRPDVDGLRGIAVLSVIFYHMGLLLPGGLVSQSNGGFVGVDVFFVISGYLITGVIYRQMVSGTFALSGFYARRIRRILPAFYVVLISTTLFVITRVFPDELRDYCKSAVAAMFSVSNVYFWATTNYFAAPAITKPLLHTWSLGVEEQFYLFWPPLLLLIVNRWPKRLGMAVVGIAVTSLLLSVYGVFAWPHATFYLISTRGWELALGGMLALKMIPSPESPWAREAAGLAGIALVAAADIFLRAHMSFPGAWALLPCGGTALVIAAGEKGPNLVGRALSLKPIVFVGLISYSLYLWHWPILVCQGMYSLFPGGAIGRAVKVETFVLMFLLSALSWRYVEQPIRHQRWSTKSTIGGAVVASLALLVLGRVGMALSATQFTAPELRVASYLDYLDSHPGLEDCQVMEGQTATAQMMRPCLAIDPTKRNYLLLADSHANHLFPGLVRAYPEVHFVRATGSGCELVLPHGHFRPHCDSLFYFLYSSFFPTAKIDGILLEAHWDIKRVPEILGFVNWAHAHGYRVVVLGPIPQYDSPLPRLIAEGLRENDQAYVERHSVNSDSFDAVMTDWARKDGFAYISWTRLLCSRIGCPTETPAGVPLNYDSGHLTIEGSTFVAAKLRASGELGLVDGLKTNSAGVQRQQQTIPTRKATPET